MLALRIDVAPGAVVNRHLLALPQVRRVAVALVHEVVEGEAPV